MNLDFKVKELNINLYGETVKMRMPNVGEYKQYEKKAKGNDSEDFELMSSFLKSLGLSDENINSCYPEDLVTIINAVSGAGKK